MPPGGKHFQRSRVRIKSSPALFVSLPSPDVCVDSTGSAPLTSSRLFVDTMQTWQTPARAQVGKTILFFLGGGGRCCDCDRVHTVTLHTSSSPPPPSSPSYPPPASSSSLIEAAARRVKERDAVTLELKALCEPAGVNAVHPLAAKLFKNPKNH